ncbi:MAG: hypothetical protein HYT71_00230 [Candidatus Aenigmarchaeota archaeon]|nr:hypothetical protein [Candidatus Aenigmarchaeota archaeon]
MIEDLGKKQFIPVSRLVVIAAMVAMVILVGNGVTGFTTSLIKLQEAAANSTHTTAVLQDLQKQAGECTNTLNSTSQLFNSCRIELEDKKSENSRLSTETSVQEKNITIYVNTITTLQRELQRLTSLSDSMAVSICCLRRYVLEDDSLRYYYIQDNKTFCVSQPEDILATKEFSC